MYKIFLFCLPILVLLSSCALNSQSDSSLKNEIAQLQIANKNLEAKQVDLYSKYDASLVTIDTLNASITELYQKVSSLKQKLQDLEAIQQGNNSTISQGTTVNQQTPSNVYKNAYNDFLVSKYELASMGFKSFLKKYPEHELAVQAQYYIGECLYSQGKWADAYEEYKKIEALYQNSEFISAARLKMALCLELLGKKNETIILLQSILKDYPKSAEAFTAAEKLKVYTNDKTNNK